MSNFLDPLLLGIKRVLSAGVPVAVPNNASPPVPTDLNFTNAQATYNASTGAVDVTVSASAVVSGQNPASLSNGLNSNIATNNQPTVRLSGPTGAFSVGGFILNGGASPAAGQTLDIINTTSQLMTILNQDNGTTAKYQIVTGTGVAYVCPPYGSIRLVYDGSATAWRLKDVGAQQPRVFDVRDFGADPSLSDSASAINAAATIAAAAGGILFAPAGVTYNIASTVTILSHADMHGAIFQTAGAMNTISGGSAVACTAVLVGATNSVTEHLNIRLPQVLDTTHSLGVWSSNTRVGVECRNLLSCKVHLDKISGFSVNLLVHGIDNAYSNSDNDYYLAAIDQGQIGVQLLPSGTAGYVTSNKFHGGVWSDDGAGGGSPITGVIGILISGNATSLSSSCNDNVFFAPDLEGNAPQYHFQCYGENNTIINARWETNNGGGVYPKVNFSGDGAGNPCSYNTIVRGFNADSIVLSIGGTTANVINNRVTGNIADQWEGGQTYGTFIASNSYSNGDPTFVVMPAGSWLESGSAATGYCVAIAANQSNFKETADAYPRIQINQSTLQIKFGTGSSNLSSGYPYVGYGTSYFNIRGGTLGLQIGDTTSGGHVSFFGAAPIAQPSAIGALIDASGGTASSTIAAVPGSYSQTQLANALASIIAKVNAIEAVLSQSSGGFGLTA